MGLGFLEARLCLKCQKLGGTLCLLVTFKKWLVDIFRFRSLHPAISADLTETKVRVGDAEGDRFLSSPLAARLYPQRTLRS